MKPIFKPKRNVPFAVSESMNKEFAGFENLSVFSKAEYSNWVAPTVNVKKKNYKIRLCVDFSFRLNDGLKSIAITRRLFLLN